MKEEEEEKKHKEEEEEKLAAARKRLQELTPAIRRRGQIAEAKRQTYFDELDARKERGKKKWPDDERIKAMVILQKLGFSREEMSPFMVNVIAYGLTFIEVFSPALGVMPIGPDLRGLDFDLYFTVNLETTESRRKGSSPTVSLSKKQIEQQKERAQNPAESIVKRFQIAESFDYLLQKNRLDALKKTNPNSPLIQEIQNKILETEKYIGELSRGAEADKKKHLEWLPSLATNIGTEPFKDEALGIITNLKYPLSKQLIDSIKVEGLPDTVKEMVQNVQSSKGQDEFETKVKSLKPDDQNILLGLCDIKEYKMLKAKHMEDMVKKLHADHKYTRSMEAAAMNRYAEKILFHGVRGIAEESALNDELRRKRAAPTVEDFIKKVLPDERSMSNIYSLNGVCITTSATERQNAKNSVNFSAKTDEQNTFLHEFNHANIMSAGDSLFPILGNRMFHESEMIKDVEMVRQEMMEKIAQNFAKKEIVIPNPNTPVPKKLSSKYEEKVYKPTLKALGIEGNPEMMEELKKMVFDDKHTLVDHRGVGHVNTIPREQNLTMRIVMAFEYFQNLEKHPEEYEAGLKKIQNLTESADNKELKDLIAAYKDCFSNVAISSSYHYDDKRHKAEEVLARIEPIKYEIKPLLENSEATNRIVKNLDKLPGAMIPTAINPGIRWDIALGAGHRHSSGIDLKNLPKAPEKNIENYQDIPQSTRLEKLENDLKKATTEKPRHRLVPKITLSTQSVIAVGG